MNFGNFITTGNMLKGVYSANQQALLNRQRQQEIDNILANSALQRQSILAQQAGQGAIANALAAYGSPTPAQAAPQTQGSGPVAPQTQDSGPVATPQGVEMPGASMIVKPLTNSAPQIPAFNPVPGNLKSWNIPPQLQAQRDQEALRVMQQELQKQQADLNTAQTPQQRSMTMGNIAALQREIARMSGSAQANAAAPAAAPAAMPTAATPAAMPTTSTTDGMLAQMGVDKGLVGRALALAGSNNQPLTLAAQFMQKIKAANPNIDPTAMGYAFASAYPLLAQQANYATKTAGMTLDSYFKGLNAAVDLKNAQTRQQQVQNEAEALPSTIAYKTAMAQYYGQAMAGMGAPGQSGAGQQPDQAPNADLAQAYLAGALGSTSGPMGTARQNTAFAQLSQIGLTPAAKSVYQNNLAASKSAVAQMEQRKAMIDATAQALETQLGQAQQLAKQLNLNGPVVWNGTVLKVGGKTIPTDSVIYQTFQKYDALVADASREAGAQQMFGKATVAGLKVASDVVNSNKGVGLKGVLEGLHAGAMASTEAINNTISVANLTPTLKLIASSSKPEAAAKAFGYTPIDKQQLAEYAKQYGISESQASMALALNPGKPFYVVGYQYGR